MSPEEWERRGRYLDVHGHHIFVIDEARAPGGPTLLLLHGFPTSSHDFWRVLPALARRGRVVAHDHPGFGLSGKPEAYSYSLIEQAEIALGVWRALDIRSGHIIAHDYGTSVCTELLARRERGLDDAVYHSVTLCNGSVHIELARPRLIQRLLERPRLGRLVSRLSREPVLRYQMRRLWGDAEPADDDLQAMWSLLTRGGGRRTLPLVARYLDERRRYWHRWIGALERLDLPAHILWGTLDPVARPAIAERLHREIPDARLTRLDGVGHYPMLEAPERWSDAVLTFIAQQA